MAPEWGWAWPANRRMLYNRASADPDGKPWSERKAYVRWDEEAGRWVGPDVPGLRRRQGAVLPAAGGRERAGRPRRRRPVHHAGRRQGLAVRAERAARRPAAGALRAGRVAGPQRAVPPAGQPDPRGLPAQGQPAEPVRRRARAGGLPVRLHHLPADRAPHRRRDEPLAALPVRAAAGVLLRGLAGARPRARAGAPRLGDDRDRTHRDRGPGAGHRPGGPAAGRWAGPSTRSGCPTTGASADDALRQRATRPTTCSGWRSTPTCTSRSRRSPAATSGPAGGRRGPALLRFVEEYRSRAGITVETGNTRPTPAPRRPA